MAIKSDDLRCRGHEKIARSVTTAATRCRRSTSGCANTLLLGYLWLLLIQRSTKAANRVKIRVTGQRSGSR